MSRATAGLGLFCCLLSLCLAGAGCRSGTYKWSFGLAEDAGEDLQKTDALLDEPLRAGRERETDRTMHDLDGDGVADHVDNDIDGDGTPNDQDTDDDNDGVPDAQDSDANNDGVIDTLNR